MATLHDSLSGERYGTRTPQWIPTVNQAVTNSNVISINVTSLGRGQSIVLTYYNLTIPPITIYEGNADNDLVDWPTSD